MNLRRALLLLKLPAARQPLVWLTGGPFLYHV